MKKKRHYLIHLAKDQILETQEQVKTSITKLQKTDLTKIISKLHAMELVPNITPAQAKAFALEKSKKEALEKAKQLALALALSKEKAKIKMILKKMAKKKERKIARKKFIKKVQKELQHEEKINETRMGEEVALFDEKSREEDLKNPTVCNSFSDHFKLKSWDKWLNYSLGYGTSFANIITDQDSTKQALKATLTLSPIKYFFIGTTLSKTINNNHNPYYEPDFSYSFGYSDWHQDTVSFVYSNYSDNKFFPTADKQRFNFNSGTWDLGYKTKYKGYSLSTSLKYTHSSKNAFFTLKAAKAIETYRLSASYKRYLHMPQDQLTLGVSSSFFKTVFATGSIYLYSHPEKQGAGEPDYAFSVAWKHSGKKRKYSIKYSNYYTGTRFPWKETKGPTLDKGAVSFSMNF